MNDALQGLSTLLVGHPCTLVEQISDMLKRQSADIVEFEGSSDALEGQLETVLPHNRQLDLVVICAPLGCFQSDKQLKASGLDPAIWAGCLPSLMEAISTRMKARSCIVIVGGPSGNGGWPGWVRSGAAMAAAYQIVQAQAATLGPRQIRVNAVAFGVTENLADTISVETGTTVAAVKMRIPTKQWMTSEALENTLLFLLHPSSSFISGEVMALDGGWNVWGRLNAIERVQ